MNSPSPLPPPEGYASWLDYAVETIDTRSVQLMMMFDDPKQQVDRDAIRAEARKELLALKRVAVIMEGTVIRTEADYLAALRVVSALVDLDPAADSPEGVRLGVLGTLVQAYEAQYYPIDPPEPTDAIKFRIEQSGITDD